MNVKQQRRLKMLLSVRVFLQTNEATIAKLPNMVELITKLDEAIVQIQQTSQARQEVNTSTSVNKKELRSYLTTGTVDLSRRLQAFFKYTNNQQLLAETKMTDSMLKNLTDLELIDATRSLISKTNTRLEVLAPYEVNDTLITNLHGLCNSFSESIPQARQKQLQKHNTIQSLNTCFDNADEVIENIDLVMELVRLSMRSFYDNYKLARKVVESAQGYITVKCTVVDALTGQGIPDVTVTLHLDKMQTNPVLEKKTALKGGFSVKTLKEGVYTVVASKVGYKSQSMKLTVNNDHLNELVMKIERS